MNYSRQRTFCDALLKYIQYLQEMNAVSLTIITPVRLSRSAACNFQFSDYWGPGTTRPQAEWLIGPQVTKNYAVLQQV